MKISLVDTPKKAKLFLEVPRIIYKNDPVWVSPLDKEIENIFRPETNIFHSHGVIDRWILQDSNDQLIGRIAAFVDHHKASNFEQPTGGIGYFECINDFEAAKLLFDTAKTWLIAKGMKAMDGPINFGENDRYWGLLVEGFTHPTIGMNYHPPYYQALFEKYQFATFFEQRTNMINMKIPFPERFNKISNWVANKEGNTFEHITLKNINKYVEDFKEIYNDGWQFHEGFVPMTTQNAKENLEKLIPIMDEKLIWFAYVHKEPASFIVVMPDANQLLKPFKGKLGVIEKIRFLYAKKFNRPDRLRVVVMGTKTRFQKLGLESALFMKLHAYTFPQKHYDETELSWVGDFNPKMQSIHDATGAYPAKKHITYRYVFDNPGVVQKPKELIEKNRTE